MPRRKPLQLALQEQPGIKSRFHEFRFTDLLEDSKARRAHQRITIERAALVAVFKAGGALRRQQGRERDTAADALAEGHDVGLDPGVLVVEKFSSPTDAGLDLVDDQQQAL